MRIESEETEEAEVPMSPLIDAVFLLLIFFLVTTMMKQMEKQIPINLPDSTAAPAAVIEIDEVILALDREGRYFQTTQRDARHGGIDYTLLSELVDKESQQSAFAVFLRDLATERGNDTSIRIDADRDVEIQNVIDALDILQIQGFEKVSVRLMADKENVYFQMPLPAERRRTDIPMQR